MNILIVDDDRVSRTLLTKILGRYADYHITTADDGETAWLYLDDPARSFDVVFLDLGLPGIGGFEVLKRIREAPLLKHVQVILCTAANDRATVVKAVEFGVRHYVVKPCTEATVDAKLRQLQPIDESTARRFAGR